MKKEILLLVVILFVACLARLYKISSPIADWHAWRQADTSAVSRNFVASGFDVLHPSFDDLSNVASGKDNLQGYRFVEFPLYNLLQAGLYVWFPYLSIEQWGRVVSIIASLCSTFFLFFIVKKYTGSLAGFLSAFFFAFLPFNIYYSRTILPEPLMVMATLGGIYFFDRWTDKKNFQFSIFNFQFLLALIFTASALLLKPFALFFLLPIIILAWNTFGSRVFFKYQLWIFAVFSIAPLIFWRLWIQQFPEGIPASDWLFNAGNIRFKGSFFYWLFADRIGRLILGYWGIGLLSLGLVKRLEFKKQLFLFSFIVSTLIYFVIIARGNVQHDYYQIAIMPGLAIFLGIGSSFLLQPKEMFNKYISYMLFAISTVFTLLFGWYFIRDYYNINNPSIVVAGEAVDRLTPKDAKVIALYNGDTSFLYQTKRKGWASLQNDIDVMTQKGADFLVIARPTKEDFNGFGRMYRVVSSSTDYLLLRLH